MSLSRSRRRFLKQLSLGSGGLLAAGVPATLSARTPLRPSPELGAETVARDESFWAAVGDLYDRTGGILNLEHGYWSRMARPVQQAYFEALDMLNRQNSYYARREYPEAEAAASQRVAQALGAHPDEVVITRNATEAAHNLIRQYRGLGAGDAVLLADVDYPGFKSHMQWLATGRGVRTVQLAFAPRMSQTDVLNTYVSAFDQNPDVRLALLTHASNQHGLVIPVREIAHAARERGIDVICDAAQSWGLLDFRVDDLGVDWMALNLHKWIGAPLGTGALYMRRGTLEKVAPYPGETDDDNSRVAARVHPGTFDFAARLTIPTALDFHDEVGAANKEARLRYLRSIWTTEAEKLSHIEVLGGSDEAAWSGIGSFRVAGKRSLQDAQALQLELEEKFGIFTVLRKGLASGCCVRVTPQVFNTPDHMLRLVDALRAISPA